MFVLKEENTFDWPVKVRVPVAGGKHETQRFSLTFRVMPINHTAGFADTADGATTQQTVAATLAFVDDIVVGWSDVRDEKDEDIPFTTEALRQLASIPYVQVAIAKAYAEAVSGREYAAKN